ncbi:hypothetical protein [Deinococcus sp.]|uniref:hypothetical protein n=1 Tax=Deinococcus sp. TaxID=47478 RepID=UPI003C7CD678
MAESRRSQPRKNFALRLSPELYAALERWAASDLRSVNAQIEYLLTEAARRSGRLHARALPDAEANGRSPSVQPDVSES